MSSSSQFLYSLFQNPIDMYRSRFKVFEKATKLRTKDGIEREVVTLLKTPVKVVCVGGVTPSKIAKQPDQKPNELILILTGNPGITVFYERFAAQVHKKSKLPVWVVSHGGHENLPAPALNQHQDLYTVQGQVRQKLELIDTYLRGVKLRCVGHSIGAKMLLDVLNSGDSYSAAIESGYLLFPTIERMAESPNGKFISFLTSYLFWPLIWLTVIFSFFPTLLQVLGVWVACFAMGAPLFNDKGLLRLLEPKVLRRVLYLAHDEMKNVVTRDSEVIRKFQTRLRFIYSAKDKWTPGHYDDLKKDFPGIRAEVSKDICHSFSLTHSTEVAEIICAWLEEEQKKE